MVNSPIVPGLMTGARLVVAMPQLDVVVRRSTDRGDRAGYLPRREDGEREQQREGPDHDGSRLSYVSRERTMTRALGK